VIAGVRTVITKEIGAEHTLLAPIQIWAHFVISSSVEHTPLCEPHATGQPTVINQESNFISRLTDLYHQK
jgi:hypothetical protein